jgi:hypothetical protein
LIGWRLLAKTAGQQSNSGLGRCLLLPNMPRIEILKADISFGTAWRESQKIVQTGERKTALRFHAAGVGDIIFVAGYI